MECDMERDMECNMEFMECDMGCNDEWHAHMYAAYSHALNPPGLNPRHVRPIKLNSNTRTAHTSHPASNNY